MAAERPIQAAFSGRFVDFADQGGRATLTATLNDNGTLTGNLSGPDGDLPWTAERVNGK